MQTAPVLNKYFWEVEKADPLLSLGKVTQVVGLLAEASGMILPVGQGVYLHPRGVEPVLGEVVGFRGERMLVMPYAETRGLSPGCPVSQAGSAAMVRVGPKLLGRVIDGLGYPVDAHPSYPYEALYPLYNQPPSSMSRKRITEPVDVGVRAVNALLTIGKGQRMGVFAGSGVGKSSLLSMIARHTSADVSVVALVGERGREVREFIERDLGREGLKRSVVVVATSDQPALMRIRAAYLATAIAEYFRDEGADVVLMMDSVTRFALASREVGLSVGEPPTTKGYPPSVFAQLPRLLERAGTSENKGSITGIYSVLVEGDDVTEPVADAMRSILDGHIVLTRELADQHHYPAIETMGSVSRLGPDLNPPEIRRAQQSLAELLSAYRRSEDLINIGAYAKGTNPTIDMAINLMGDIRKFLTQPMEERADLSGSRRQLLELVSKTKERRR
jgi:flagellum-specific ATP synthase